MNKKSQGISVNVIIIAAIALIVLVVLIAVFTGRFGGFTGGVKTTEEYDAPRCMSSCTNIGYQRGHWAAEKEVNSDCSNRGYDKKDVRNYGIPRTDGMICCCEPK